MTTFLAIASGLLLVVGALFALVGAIGILRFPTRSRACTPRPRRGRSGPASASGRRRARDDLRRDDRAVAAVLFFLLTAPVSAHLIGRAIRIAGYPALLNYDAMAPKTDPGSPNDPAASEDKSTP